MENTQKSYERRNTVPIGEGDEMVVLTTTNPKVLESILLERQRQDEKWGSVPRLGHDFGHWLKILIEEIGEASKADLEANTQVVTDGSFDVIHTQAAVDHELTQAAAVLVAWLEHREALRAQQGG